MLAFFLGLCLALMAALGGRSVLTGAKLKRIASTGGQGYWLLAHDGGVFAFGDAPFFGANPNAGNDIVGLASTGSRDGYWTADDDGTVFDYGKAKDLGDRGGSADDLAGFAARPQGDGYWFVSRTGEVTAKGAAVKFGEPIVINGVRNPLPNANRAVGIASTPSGNGYWVIARDGGVFSYGDATFYGSTGDIKLNQPIVGFAPRPQGDGYWFVANDGGVFTYGPGAAFHGSLGGNPPAGGISGIAATASGNGYWLVGVNGKVYPFGDATNYGDLPGLKVAPNQPVIGIVATPIIRTIDPQVDHHPAAADDSGSVDEDGSGTFKVLANDSELQDAPVAVSVSGAPAHGSTLVSNAAITYTPNSDYSGSDSLTYTATDVDGDTASAKLSITVKGSNDAPKASGASIGTDADVAKSGNLSGSDADDDVLTYSKVTDPAHGTVAVQANGAYTYTPGTGYVGTDSFTYKVNDGKVDSAPATVIITVSHVNHAPSIVLDEKVVTDGGVSVQEDSEGTKVEFSTSDPDKDDTLTVTARVVEDAKAFGLAAPPVSELIQSLDVSNDNGSQSLAIVPNPNQHGSATIEIKVSDGGSTDTATFEFTVDSVDDPVAAVADTFDVAEDSTDTDLAVLANDSAVDNPVVVEIMDQPDHGTATVNADGTVHYVPEADYPGTLASAPDGFTYRVTDADGDNGVTTVAINVTQVNDAPEFTSVPGDQVVAEDGISSGLTVTFTDKDSPLASFDYDFGSDNEALVTDDGFDLVGGSLASGSVTFTVRPVPDANDVTAGGPATITGTVTDDGGLSATASFLLSVTPFNDAPTIAPIASQTMDEDTSIDVPITVADIDSDLAGITLGEPTSNNSALLPGSSLDVTPGETPGSWNLKVTPPADGNGTATIQVSATDGDSGIAQPTASFVLTVNNVDDVVVANDDIVSIDQDSDTTTINVLDNDENLGDGGLEVSLLNAPSAGFSAVVNSDNTIGFSAPAGFTGVVEFGYQLLDADNDHDTAKVTVNVKDVASSPSISDGQASQTDEDMPSAPMSFTLSDPDTSTYDLEVTASSSNESIVPNSGLVVTGTGPERTLVVTPKADANGEVTITVKASDGSTFDTTSLVLTVNPVDDDPSAENDSVSTDEDTVLDNIDVLGNDTLGNDPKVGDQPIVVTISSVNDSVGTVSVNGDNTLKYVPAPDFEGIDTVRYTVTDQNGDASSASVTIEVKSVDDEPGAVDDSATVLEDGSTDINVLGGGTIVTLTADPEGNDTGIGDTPVTVTIVTEPAHGTATVNPDNTIRYVPAANYFGEDTLRYRVTDADDDWSEADVFINVESVDDLPVAVADEAGTSEDHPVAIDVLDNDGGFGDGGIKVTIAEAPGAGEATVNEDNTITYTPAADKHGEDSFSYLVTDGDGSKDEATVTVTIESVDDQPVAQDDSLTMTEDGDAQSINVLDNDSGLGDGDLVVTILGEGPANGSVEIDGTAVSYKPDADFNGTDGFSYQVTDDDGDSAEGDVSVTVSAVNDAPVATDDALEVAKNAASATVNVLDNDSDVDNTKGELKISITSLPSVPGQLNCSGAGQCTYTPGSEGGITGPVTFTYEVKDPAGATDSGTVTIDIPANRAPTLVSSSDPIFDADTEAYWFGTIVAEDLDGDPLTWKVETEAPEGSIVLSDGTWQWLPGSGVPSDFTISFTDGKSDPVMVNIGIPLG